MKGAHYSLLRLLTCHSPAHPPLPTLPEAREIFSIHLARAPKAQTVQTKHLLQRPAEMDSMPCFGKVFLHTLCKLKPPSVGSVHTPRVRTGLPDPHVCAEVCGSVRKCALVCGPNPRVASYPLQNTKMQANSLENQIGGKVPQQPAAS